MKFSFALLLVCFVAVPASAATGSAYLPPFTYTGRIVNYDHDNLADVTSGAEIRARRNGVLVARSTISVVSGTVCNYSLAVPMANTEVATAARTGDTLTFEIDYNSQTGSSVVYAATNSFVAVGAPGRVARVDICAAADSNGDGVADQYAADMATLMSVYGIPGTYDPNADYDGDGFSNYAEYLAGTDPFSAADSLRILSIDMVPENDEVVKVTFLPGKRRAYSVRQSSNEVANAVGVTNSFHRRPFQLDRAKGATTNEFLQTGSEDAEVRTLYLLKDGAASQFYRLHLE